MNIFFHTFFKILGFLLAILVFLIIISLVLKFSKSDENKYFSHWQGEKGSSEKIAVIKLNGPIISNPSNIKNFDFFGVLEVIYPSLIKQYLKELETQDIQGVIISIDSPGGAVSASQEIYKIINKFKIRNNIPIYFHSNNILASGGYWVALSGDKIFASYGAIVGSIGVKGPNWIYYNSPTYISSGILGNTVESPKGIKLFSNTAGKSKDLFNPFREPNKEEISKLQSMVDDIYEDFVTLVSSKRKIEGKFIVNDIGAMIFNTKNARKKFLIDREINLEEVIDEMTKNLNLKSIEVIINQIENKYSILNLDISSYIYDYNLLKNDKLKITEKFCNNFNNQFSSVSIQYNYLDC